MVPKATTHAAPLPAESAWTTQILVAEGLRKSFGDVPALRGASLAVRAGEVVAVVGPSGSGKSTLLQCAAGVMTPDAGSVTFGDVEVSALSERERAELRRTRFGFVFQSGRLLPELSALDNVALPLFMNRVNRRKARATAAETLERLGVGPLAHRLPSRMSGGEAQRVSVARALVTAPAVIFADEPTGALDSVAARELLAQLRARCAENAAAVVIVTHDHAVASWADRVVHVSDGRTAGREA